MSSNGQDFPEAAPPKAQFSERESKLKKCFERIGDGGLVGIFEGAIAVLSDPTNKDKYAQAANSIRGITNKLLRHIGRDSKSLLVEFLSAEDDKSKAVREINSLFEKIISFIPDDPNVPKRQIVDSTTAKFKNLLSDMITGKVLMKQKLRTLFGTEAQLKSLPPEIKATLDKTLKIWDECHDYFTDISHHGTAVAHERFMQNWYRIQDCWWSACRIFIDTRPEIDHLIEKGPPR